MQHAARRSMRGYYYVWVASTRRHSRCTRGHGKRSGLGNAITGDAEDTAAGRPMKDDNGIVVVLRDGLGGDGVACHGGHGDSEPNIEGLRMRVRRMGERNLLFVRRDG